MVLNPKQEHIRREMIQFFGNLAEKIAEQHNPTEADLDLYIANIEARKKTFKEELDAARDRR
jgi:hypothetical protein